MNNREIGRAYEQVAGDYLTLHGYRILEYNFRCRNGEVDIVARDGEYLVFCEVKYRKDRKKGDPLDAVTLEKQRRISKAAAYYMTRKRYTDMPCRFDVVGILGDEIRVVKNAFEYIG